MKKNQGLLTVECNGVRQMYQQTLVIEHAGALVFHLSLYIPGVISLVDLRLVEGLGSRGARKRPGGTHKKNAR